jgi:ABC-type multidrug transport system fused ATPase/permease subunit
MANSHWSALFIFFIFMYPRGGNSLTFQGYSYIGDIMTHQDTSIDQEDYSKQATIETLLKLIEKSSNWLKKMERDSLMILALLVIMPIVYFVTVLFGNDILQAKIAFLGDFFIPSVIIGVILFFTIIFYLIRRHLIIRREMKLWQERLQTLQRKTDELLSKL